MGVADGADAGRKVPDIPAKTDRRLSFLDGVRALAAVYVLAHHIWFTYYPQYPTNTGPAWLGWLLYGHLAVAVFIVVSGFSLTIGPAGRDFQLGGVRRFLRRRAWRILPPYWAALALSAVVFGLVTPWLTGAAVTARGLAVHALLLQDVINTPKPNGAFWSIAIEWQIYFLFPLVLLLRRRLGPVRSTALLLGGVIAAEVGAEHVAPLHRLLDLTPQFFGLFVFGVAAAAVVRPGGHAPRGTAALGLACWAAFAALAAALGSVRIDREYFWIDLLVGLGTACLLAALADGGLAPLRRVLAGPVASRVGLFSYSIYLVHLPMLWLTKHFVVDHLPGGALAHFFLLCALGGPVVLSGAYVFHRGCERPFTRHRSLAELTGRKPGYGVPATASVARSAPATSAEPLAPNRIE